MNPIENPLWLSGLSFLAAIAGQVGYAIIVRRDLTTLRDSHYWIDDPGITRLTAGRDMSRISAICLPGAFILIGGFPQALAISLSLTTFLLGLRGEWWSRLIVPLVYVGADVVAGASLRYFSRKRIGRSDETTPANPGRQATAFPPYAN